MMRLILILTTILVFSFNAQADRPYFEIQRLGSVQIPEAYGYAPLMHIFEYRQIDLNSVKVTSDMRSFCEEAGERGGDPDSTIFYLITINPKHIKAFCSINMPVLIN